MANNYLREAAKNMRWELETNRLVVSLAPCENGRDVNMIRVVDSTNPGWYQDLCDQYQTRRSTPRKSKKSDTMIKRKSVLRALAEIESGHCQTVYAQRLLPYVFEYYERFIFPYETQLETAVDETQLETAVDETQLETAAPNGRMQQPQETAVNGAVWVPARFTRAVDPQRRMKRVWAATSQPAPAPRPPPK